MGKTWEWEGIGTRKVVEVGMAWDGKDLGVGRDWE